MKILNLILVFFTILVFISCTQSGYKKDQQVEKNPNTKVHNVYGQIDKSRPPQPTIIEYPKNSQGVLYYSENNLPYTQIVQNMKNIHTFDEEESMGLITERAVPVIPGELFIRNENKFVKLKALINITGEVESIIVIESGGDPFDNNSIVTLKKCKYRIFKESNQPVPYCVIVPFDWRLR